MATVTLKVITPAKIVFEEEIQSITAPSVEGEITVLPRHENFFTMLKEGIITIRRPQREDEYLAIGGGYFETDGQQITVLVSKAYNQDELDAKQVEKARADAQKILEETKDQAERQSALASLRRIDIDLQLLQKKRKRPVQPPSSA
jgi:F-type H+-transporting ATPase subunit epsilon